MEHSRELPNKRYQLPTVMHNGFGVAATEANRVLNSMINSVAWSKITSTPATLSGLLTILIYLLLCSCTKSRQLPQNEVISDPVSNIPVSNIKDIQPVSTANVYEAFGSLINLRTNTDVQFIRIGKNHLNGGNPYYRLYNEATNHWYDPVLIRTTTKDCSAYATKMDNDSIVVFTGESNNGKGGDWSIDIKLQKCDTNMNFSPPIDFHWSSVPVRLQRSSFFNGIPHGDNPGEYYSIIYQANVDTGIATHSRISVIKTTDYWNTYTEVGIIFDGIASYSETALAYLGSGKFLALLRNNQGGTLTAYESTNYCVSWTPRGVSNLYWYNNGGAEIPYIYVHDQVFDIIYQCRDARMVSISKNNTVRSNFGTTPAIYNEPEIYAHHLGVGGNASLGYPQMVKMADGNFLVTYSKQFSDNRANLFWTRDNLVTDPSGVPPEPTLSTSLITSTSFRVDITKYTDKQLENIRYFQQDISTSPDFSDFVTCNYRGTTRAYPAVEMHDIRMVGMWDIYHELTTATTYYLRIRACNNTGCSDYTTIAVTTQ